MIRPGLAADAVATYKLFLERTPDTTASNISKQGRGTDIRLLGGSYGKVAFNGIKGQDRPIQNIDRIIEARSFKRGLSIQRP